MDIKLSPKDWGQISDYLDGQLIGPQKDAFEKQVSIQASLKLGLEEMRLTRSILRSAPRRKLPHNFTLTRAQVMQTSKPGLLFPVFSFASALSLVLIMVSLLIPRLPLRAPMMAASQGAQEAFKLEAQATKTVNSEIPSIIIWGNPPINLPVDGMGGGGPPIPAPLRAEKQGEIPSVTPTVQNAPSGPPPSAIPEAAESAPPAQAAEIAGKTYTTQTPLPTQGTSLSRDQMDTTGPILGIRPVEQEGRIAVTPTTSRAVSTSESARSARFWPFLRMILAITAILFAVAALIVRKMAQP
jgi:hypothetical protein